MHDLQEVDAFLVQPFDSLRAKREEAVRRALEHALPGVKINLRTSDDNLPESNWIHEEVFGKLASADLVVVDTFPAVSDPQEPFGRPNVYLELGFSLAVNQPTVVIESRDKNRHSDLLGLLSVRLDGTLAPEKRLESLAEELTRALGTSLSMRVLSARIRLSERELLPIVARHIALQMKPPGTWQGTLAQGAGRTGLRVFTDMKLHHDTIVEVWLAGHELVAIATGWVRNATGVWQADVVRADLRLIIENAKLSPTLRVELKTWEGPLLD